MMQISDLYITGKSFVNTEYLMVRFGWEREGGGVVHYRHATWISETELTVESPAAWTNITRVPVFVSNNAQDFDPLIPRWDPDETSYDKSKNVQSAIQSKTRYGRRLETWLNFVVASHFQHV